MRCCADRDRGAAYGEGTADLLPALPSVGSNRTRGDP